jgi:hypothetical protein
MSLIAEPATVAQDEPNTHHRGRWTVALVVSLVLIAVVVPGGLYFLNRGPSWTLWVSGDGDFRHHFVPVYVTTTAQTTQGASVTLRVTNDLTSREVLQCVAFAGPTAPTYNRTIGFAAGTVYYHSGSQRDEVTGGPVSVGAFRAGETRTVTMPLSRTAHVPGVLPISATSLTAQCFAERQVNGMALN